MNRARKDDVWDVCWRREEARPTFQEWSPAGAYRLGSVRRFPDGDETIEVPYTAEREPTTNA